MCWEKSLYPLQDKVLAAVETAGAGFYLTGGTALSRFYYQHRYSEDLDFFANDDDDFDRHIKAVFSALRKNAVAFVVLVNEDRFRRIDVEQALKVEFVNDVPFYLGERQKIPGAPFSAIDNPLNILANKITALRDRDEPKDVADIREIALKIRPDWREIFSAAESKAAGIFPPEIAEKLERFDPALLDRIRWIVKPDAQQFQKDMRAIALDILGLKMNP